MFHLSRDENGFLIRWDDADSPAARSLKTEITLEGLQRGQESAQSLTILPYRNSLETLGLLIDLLNRLHLPFAIAPAVAREQEAGEAERNLVNAIREGVIPQVDVNPILPEFRAGRALLEYQRRGVERHLAVRNGAEFSVPGAGKTTVALAYWALARRSEPNLGLWVIGPLSCFRPWEEEYQACFGSEPHVLRIRGTRHQREDQLAQAQNFDLVLCSYHTAWRETDGIARCLDRRAWLVLLDEAHYIKSMSGALSSAVRTLAPKASRRMVLTGTPMPRSPEDLWSLFTYLWPTESLLGNAQQHALRCKQPLEINCEELRVTLSPFFHRTCKDDLGLPPIEADYPAISAETIPPTQRLILRLIERRTLEETTFLRPVDQRHLRRWRRARVVRLLQATSNPLLLADALDVRDVLGVGEQEDDIEAIADPEILPLVDTDSDLAAILRRYREQREQPAKVSAVVDRVRELVNRGEKVIVWTVFLGNVHLLAVLLDDLRPLTVTGSVPAYDADDDENSEETREQRIAIFKSDPNRRILIANAAACAESISLHRVCQYAIYLERSFNAAHFIQSIDRIHRQGMPPGTTAHIEIPYLPCAIERVLNRRLSGRQARLYRLLNDTMPVIGFDDEDHHGFFDVEDVEEIDALFEEVLAEIRADHAE